MDIYAQNILDRYKTPFFKGRRIDPAMTRLEANHSCGDTVEIELASGNGKTITDYSFTGSGCAISMASADMLGDIVKGMTEEGILGLSKDDVYQILGIEISLRRSKCALLPLLAIQNAILTANGRDVRVWTDYHL